MPETQTGIQSASNKDVSIMSGGPAGDHGKPMPEHGEPHPETKETKKESTATKFEINGKTFESAQEMSKYVADLERKVLNPQSTVQTQVQTQINTNQKELIDGRPVDEVMFTDPDKYTRYLENKIESKINQQKVVEERKTQFWTTFYSDNPDLKGKEEIIDALVQKNWVQWKDLPVTDFSKTVANSSRTVFKKAGLTIQATEIKNNPAGTLSSSGESAPTVTQERKVLTFVEEMQERRRARQKAK